MIVNVVCGPPASGKTTLVNKRRNWGDVIVDWDTLWMAITGEGIHDKPAGLWPVVNAVRERLLEAVHETPIEGRIWIIGGMPSRKERQHYREHWGATIIVLETSPNECLRRLQAAGARGRPLDVWEPLIRKWWGQYQSDPGDIVIKS